MGVKEASIDLVDRRPPLSIDGLTDFLLVAVPRDAAVQVSRSLLRLQMPVDIKWEGPLPSPASKGAEQRALVRGFITERDDITIDFLIEKVRQRLGDAPVVVGAANLFRSKGAFLAGITDAKVPMMIQPHWHAAILLAPIWLLVHPRGDTAS